MRNIFYSLTIFSIIATTVISSSNPQNQTNSSDENHIPASCPGQPTKENVGYYQPYAVGFYDSGVLMYIDGTNYNVLHMWNNLTKKGTAHGRMLDWEIQEVVPLQIQQFVEKFDEKLMKMIPFVSYLPDFKTPRHRFFTWALKPAVHSYYQMDKMTGNHDDFYTELTAIAEGSKVPFADLLTYNYLPAITNVCGSLWGGWSQARKDGDGLLMGKGLDWWPDAKMNKFPTLFIYHHDLGQPAGTENTFAILGYPGFIAGLTGMSHSYLGVGEKVNRSPQQTSKSGLLNIENAWHLTVRKMLKYANTIEEAVEILKNETKEQTEQFYMSIGDSASEKMNLVEHTKYGDVKVYSDQNFTRYPNHPTINDFLWYSPQNEPNLYNDCMTELIYEQYGQMDAEKWIHEFMPVIKTGTHQAAVMDFQNNFFYFSNSLIDQDYNLVSYAYENMFSAIDLNNAFSFPEPKFSEEYFKKEEKQVKWL